MNYPEYVEIDNKRYKINTDFRVAIECNRIAEDETISDYERALAIIYILFGDDGLENSQHYEQLLTLAKKYLSCGKEVDSKTNEKKDMDYIQDYSYIKTSFRSDFGIKLDEEKMHWWEFSELINGLSYSEFGNCCILNRIRSIRNINLNEIKDSKERDKIKKLQEEFALKKKEKKKPTKKEKQSAYDFIKMLKNRKE